MSFPITRVVKSLDPPASSYEELTNDGCEFVSLRLRACRKDIWHIAERQST